MEYWDTLIRWLAQTLSSDGNDIESKSIAVFEGLNECLYLGRPIYQKHARYSPLLRHVFGHEECKVIDDSLRDAFLRGWGYFDTLSHMFELLLSKIGIPAGVCFLGGFHTVAFVDIDSRLVIFDPLQNIYDKQAIINHVDKKADIPKEINRKKSNSTKGRLRIKRAIIKK